MSWNFEESAATTTTTDLVAEDKTRVSHSDTAHAGDNCPMPDDQGARPGGGAPDEQAHHAGSNKEGGNAAVSMSNLIESTRRQHDRDFFEKFLRNPAAARPRGGPNGANHQPPEQQLQPDAASLHQHQQQLANHQATLIDQLLPQVAAANHQSALFRSSSHLLDPQMHSPNSAGFVLADTSSYQQLRDENSSSQQFAATTTAAASDNPNPSFYNNINLIANQHISPSAAFNGLGMDSLFYNPNNQLNASDSSNVFSGNSESLSASDHSREDPFENRPGGSGASSKTYSSVLHPSSQQATMLQQQHQLSERLTLLDIQQRLSAAGLQSIFSADAGGQQQLQHRLMDDSSRSFDEFLLGQPQQQQQQQAVVGRRNQPFQAHQQHQPGARTSGLYQQQSRQGIADAASGRQMTAPSAAGAALQLRNASSLAQKAPDSGLAGQSMSGGGRRNRNKSPFFSATNYLGEGQPGFKLDVHGTGVVNSGEDSGRFSRKVFVGGLPPDIDEEEIKASFRRFGALVVDWPHKAESKSYFPPKGYAFLLFQEESSVQTLIDSCFQEEDKLYLCVSSPTIKDKPVQIRPWRLNDSDFVLDSTLALDPRKTVFVGGVPRPLKASELASIMNNLYGGVCYAGIDTDPELKYPKGAGRVAFSNYQSYIAAISARFVHIHHSEIEKRVEVKPYVLDDQFCDECQGSKCNNKFAPFFCANITCLRYYCDNCWSTVHSQPGKEFHKPLVKEGGDRPRGAQSFKW